MNPRRKEILIEDILKNTQNKILPEFVYKFSVNQLLELKEVVERAYREGYQNGIKELPSQCG